MLTTNYRTSTRKAARRLCLSICGCGLTARDGTGKRRLMIRLSRRFTKAQTQPCNASPPTLYEVDPARRFASSGIDRARLLMTLASRWRVMARGGANAEGRRRGVQRASHEASRLNMAHHAEPCQGCLTELGTARPISRVSCMLHRREASRTESPPSPGRPRAGRTDISGNTSAAGAKSLPTTLTTAAPTCEQIC